MHLTGSSREQQLKWRSSGSSSSSKRLVFPEIRELRLKKLSDADRYRTLYIIRPQDSVTLCNNVQHNKQAICVP